MLQSRHWASVFTVSAVFSAVIFLPVPTAVAAEGVDYVWWEAESATKTTLDDKHPFNAKHKKLSGGISIGTGRDGKRTATYTVNVPSKGKWHLYVRKFWKHGPFKWRFRKQKWTELTKGGTSLLDTTQLQQHCINWVKLGKVDLPAGEQTFAIEGLETKGAFAIDCFVLTKHPFVPSGLRKPGEKLGLADSGMWAFEPDYDMFAKKDAVDLRGLNEKIAGQSGYVKMNKEGDFITGAGKPIRFWAVNTSVQRASGTDSLVAHAKHLAKRGVNMVRHHGHLNPGANDNPMSTNKKEIDAAQKLVAVMKQEGIYTTFSPFWATAIKPSNSWKLKGHPAGDSLTGMLFYDKALQKIYKKWLRDFLTAPNPYDKNKTPLAKDPALAIFQLQNEDSMFFWTMTRHKGAKLARLQKVYDQWRKKNKLPPGKLNLKFWELNKPNDSHRETMHFFAETMRKFNQDMATYLRKDLGYKGLINAGNWRTANQVKLLDLERWSYMANEVIGVNRYVNGGAGRASHVNPNKAYRTGYAVDQGDYFQDTSVLNYPQRMPTNAKLVKGRAYIISESTWVSPMSYQSEGAFLISAYSSLNGMDNYYWFATGSAGFDSNLQKFQIANPVTMGTWPAAALMFRKGYIKRGKPAVHEERALDDMWQLRSPVIAEEAGFDANRDTSITPRSAIKGGVNPLAYLVGPVEVVYDGDPAKSSTLDLKKYIKGDIITSVTGEIVLDKKIGLCTLNAPKAQGATGFLSKAGEIKTDALKITSQNHYATVLTVSLDGKSLRTSKRILVQITTRNRPYGWRQSTATYTSKKKQFSGFKIDKKGSAPWNVENTKMTISLRNSSIKHVTVLDINLYPTKTKLSGKSSGGRFILTPPADSMYLLLEK